MPSVDYCLKWDSKRGTFNETPVERSIERWGGFSCWDLGDRGVLIMGYNKWGDDDRTTDLVDVNGLTSSSSFTLKHKIR